MIIRTLAPIVISALSCSAFVPLHGSRNFATTPFVNAGATFRETDNCMLRSLPSDTLPEISTMKAGELKKELDSYGISHKSFFEKYELVEAVQKARDEDRKPVGQARSSSTQSSGKSTTSSTSTTENSSDTKSREEKIKEEMENCSSMKASEMKKELISMGISIKSFLEKSEFLRALAEARVDGVKNPDSSGDDGYAEYANVEVLPANDPGPRKKSKEGDSDQSAGNNPFGGAGGNPFGGAAGNPFGGSGGVNPFGGASGGNPFGGAAGGNPFGGAGGMADILKNMGGMGGMGGMGDMMGNMGKAQELMKNPKVMEIIQKAQGNPKIMQAVTECMSNPAAFAKYQNDPEVSTLINELKQFM